MAFITITKPAQGKATWKSIIDAVIDNLTYLFSRQNSDVTLSNGSFENDADADGYPDNWTFTAYPSGSFLLDFSTSQHGQYSAKFTSPGGASNGGGYLHSDDFIPCSPNRPVELLWELKSSVAGVSNRVEIFWYKADQTASVTTSTTLYNSTSNPTSWTAMSALAVPPSDARYAKVRITGCHTASTTAGSTWFDNLQFSTMPPQNIWRYDASSTWVCPAGIYRVQVECWGSGGGGAQSNATGQGGGSGSYATGNYNVTPGTSYTVTVGAGGAGGNSGSGLDGADSSFDSFVTAKGGKGGAQSGGGGGQGGALGTGYDFAIVGQNQPGSFAGGSAPRGGAGGPNGFDGVAPGGAGGCAKTLTLGGDGAAGRVIVFAL